jgi:membrane-bound lytic murein transglycosylase B
VYAADGDGDGLADVWNPAGAIAGAGRLLRANGAPADHERALFAYNHAGWYVNEVLQIALGYTAVTSMSPSIALGSPYASVVAVLGNPRIQLSGARNASSYSDSDVCGNTSSG